MATDAAGEGVNLQWANLMVNYDLPWNPNRIEQRFGRIYRIGQNQPCYLWNLVAHTTREGKVFERLFDKIEQQRKVYGDQVYDVLGNSEINRSLQDLLINAIRESEEPGVAAYLEEIVDGDIGRQLQDLLEERALASEILTGEGIGAIRDRMELALARKLQPGFIEAFTAASLGEFGGRMVRRETNRYEITRVPATVRAREREARVGGTVLDRYERVTFDKAHVAPDGDKRRAELIAPGHPLLGALIDTVLEQSGPALARGSMLIDRADPSETPRALVYLEHAITDARTGRDNIVSRRFQFVEVFPHGVVSDRTRGRGQGERDGAANGDDPLLRVDDVEGLIAPGTTLNARVQNVPDLERHRGRELGQLPSDGDVIGQLGRSHPRIDRVDLAGGSRGHVPTLRRG